MGQRRHHPGTHSRYQPRRPVRLRDLKNNKTHRRHSMKSAAAPTPVRKTRFTEATIRLFERTIPDPFVLAILITAIVAVLSLLFAPHATVPNMIAGWYKGFFDIL